MVYGNKIRKRINVKEFLDIIKEYSKDQIECTEHTFFRLDEKERKIFSCDALKEYLFHEIPILVGIQYNENYAVFYKFKNKFLRIILDIMVARKINIVTFYLIKEYQIPKI